MRLLTCRTQVGTLLGVVPCPTPETVRHVGLDEVGARVNHLRAPVRFNAVFTTRLDRGGRDADVFLTAALHDACALELPRIIRVDPRDRPARSVIVSQHEVQRLDSVIFVKYAHGLAKRRFGVNRSEGGFVASEQFGCGDMVQVDKHQALILWQRARWPQQFGVALEAGLTRLLTNHSRPP